MTWLKIHRGPLELIASLLTAAGLAIDAVVHLRLAGRYAPISDTVSQATLFRIEAAFALVLVIALLIAPWRRVTYAAAFLVAASGFGAVMLYRYVNVGSLGPLPNMYEPIWFGQKTLSAFAEAGASAAALVGLLGIVRRDRRSSA